MLFIVVILEMKVVFNQIMTKHFGFMRMLTAPVDS